MVNKVRKIRRKIIQFNSNKCSSKNSRRVEKIPNNNKIIWRD